MTLHGERTPPECISAAFPCPSSPSSPTHPATLTRPTNAQATSPADGSPRPPSIPLRPSVPPPGSLRVRPAGAANAPSPLPGGLATRPPRHRCATGAGVVHGDDPRQSGHSAPLGGSTPGLRSIAARRVPPTARPSRCQRPRPPTNSSGRAGAGARCATPRRTRPARTRSPANKGTPPAARACRATRAPAPDARCGRRNTPSRSFAALTHHQPGERTRPQCERALRPPRHPSCQTRRWRRRARRARRRRHCAGPRLGLRRVHVLRRSSHSPVHVPRHGFPQTRKTRQSRLACWLRTAPRITGDYI